jgi:hypothetical protein
MQNDPTFTESIGHFVVQSPGHAAAAGVAIIQVIAIAQVTAIAQVIAIAAIEPFNHVVLFMLRPPLSGSAVVALVEERRRGTNPHRIPFPFFLFMCAGTGPLD